MADNIAARITIAIDTQQAEQQLQAFKQEIANIPQEQKKATNAIKQTADAIAEENAAARRMLEKRQELEKKANAEINRRGRMSVSAFREEQLAAQAAVAEHRELLAVIEEIQARQKLENAQKNLSKARAQGESPQRIQALSNALRQYQDHWLKAQERAVNAGARTRQVFEQMAASSGLFSGKLKGIISRFGVMRVALMMLGVQTEGSLNRVNGALTQLGKALIILEGVQAAIKIFKWWQDERKQDQLHYAAELAEVTKTTRAIYEKTAKQHEEEKNALQEIFELSLKQNKTYADRLKLFLQFKKVTEGKQISFDLQGGNYRAAYQKMLQFARAQHEYKIAGAKNTIASIDREIADTQKQTRSGTADDMRAAKQKIRSLSDERARLFLELKRLENIDPTKEVAIQFQIHTAGVKDEIANAQKQLQNAQNALAAKKKQYNYSRSSEATQQVLDNAREKELQEQYRQIQSLAQRRTAGQRRGSLGYITGLQKQVEDRKKLVKIEEELFSIQQRRDQRKEKQDKKAAAEAAAEKEKKLALEQKMAIQRKEREAERQERFAKLYQESALQYRATSQSAVMTDSIEAMRLQSRMLVRNTPQQQLLDVNKQQEKRLAKIEANTRQGKMFKVVSA